MSLLLLFPNTLTGGQTVMTAQGKGTFSGVTSVSIGSVLIATGVGALTGVTPIVPPPPPPPPVHHHPVVTFLQAEEMLASRLYDSTEQFFIADELNQYILEALQTFNVYANFYRQEFTFNTRSGVAWYDLTDQTNLPNTLRPLTTTDQELIQRIEYRLLEPLTIEYPLTWTGSNQFAVQDILNALQQYADQCVSESGCTINESLINASPGRTSLTSDVISLRRVCWIPVAGAGFAPNCLLPADLWATQSFEAGFPQLGNGTPQMVRQSTTPPMSFDVDIQPAVNGQYDILTIGGNDALTSDDSTVLSIPDDWTWVVQFGALAQLLGRESSASDPFRAQYCAMRYKQGIQMMRSAPAALGGRINDVPTVIETVTDGDFYNANWQGLTPGQPNSLYYAGLNMLAVAPTPDTGPYSVTVSVLRNMVLPQIRTDVLPIGQDDLGPILDYAQHLAMFKCGGAEFQATLPLFQNFLRHCALYNSKLKAHSVYLELMDGLGVRDSKTNPLFSQPTPETVEAKR